MLVLFEGRTSKPRSIASMCVVFSLSAIARPVRTGAGCREWEVVFERRTLSAKESYLKATFSFKATLTPICASPRVSAPQQTLERGATMLHAGIWCPRGRPDLSDSAWRCQAALVLTFPSGTLDSDQRNANFQTRLWSLAGSFLYWASEPLVRGESTASLLELACSKKLCRTRCGLPTLRSNIIPCSWITST